MKVEAKLKVGPEEVGNQKFGIDARYGSKGIFEGTNPIKIVPDGVDISSNEAFNDMWRWIGESDAPKYMTGSVLYKLVLEVQSNLPPTYNIFLNERRENNLSTTRKDWLYEIFCSLDENQKSDFFKIIELKVNQTDCLKDNSSALDSFVNIWEDSDSLSKDVNDIDYLQLDNTSSQAKSQQPNDEQHPSVFISYSWDNENHKQWVLNLANRLADNGIYVYLDQYDLRMGKDMTCFMENAIEKADRILVVGTPEYKKRAIERRKGVGFEYSIISASLMNNLESSRFIPILRVGPKEEAFPILLQNRIGAFMDKDENFDQVYEDLVRELYNKPKLQRPPLGEKPDFA